jgi:hypothetical protein
MSHFPGTLLEGAKGVQLAEKGLESWAGKKMGGDKSSPCLIMMKFG